MFAAKWVAGKNSPTPQIISSIFFEVYSPVSASASVGKKVAALLEKRQVADAGNSSSAR
jgi:hypothetical protein